VTRNEEQAGGDARDRAALERRLFAKLDVLEAELRALREGGLLGIAAGAERVRKLAVKSLPEMRSDAWLALTLGEDALKQVDVAERVGVGTSVVSDKVREARRRLDARAAAPRSDDG
jgi:hypothetical protein